MATIKNGSTRAAAISVASRRVEITKNERDRHLHWVNEKERELSELQAKLEASEAELRVEQFTLDLLIDEATENGGNVQYLHPTGKKN